MHHAHRQSGFTVRVDWGLEGAEAILAGADAAVVVDVLSFTTTVSVALEAGIIVWPFPWGEEAAVTFAAERSAVLAASLRNAVAVARWLTDSYHGDGRVAVVAAGERWPTGGLRPAAEDLWGAGAVVAALQDFGWTGLSAEARVAADAYRGAAGVVSDLLLAGASGQELFDTGYG
ncbi:MAG: 2-phosphosulfolactate phosphatase [Mycobacteriales bacterium]